ncbi:unnamed protein product [Owenia fusiformis]|uniref:Uncharacterized protein n=1 Tax=Owenia fusiformis TaxID=6347 RepID=A0A8J1TR11_OWEFU|nr:unnamed protein product [Owenia fusiformis]
MVNMDQVPNHPPQSTFRYVKELTEDENKVLSTDVELDHIRAKNNLKMRKDLKKISDQLSTENITDIKFLLRDLIPLGKLEQVKSGIHLYDALESQQLMRISFDEPNFELLVDLLYFIFRYDLLLILGCEQHNIKARLKLRPSTCRISEYRLMLYKIIINLQEQEKRAMIGEARPWFNHLPKEQFECIKSLQMLFIQMEKIRYLAEDKVDKLQWLLHKIGSMDLVEDLKKYKRNHYCGASYGEGNIEEASPYAGDINNTYNVNPQALDLHVKHQKYAMTVPLTDPKGPPSRPSEESEPEFEKSSSKDLLQATDPYSFPPPQSPGLSDQVKMVAIEDKGNKLLNQTVNKYEASENIPSINHEPIVPASIDELSDDEQMDDSDSHRSDFDDSSDSLASPINIARPPGTRDNMNASLDNRTISNAQDLTQFMLPGDSTNVNKHDKLLPNRNDNNLEEVQYLEFGKDKQWIPKSQRIANLATTQSASPVSPSPKAPEPHPSPSLVSGSGGNKVGLNLVSELHGAKSSKGKDDIHVSERRGHVSQAGQVQGQGKLLVGAYQSASPVNSQDLTINNLETDSEPEVVSQMLESYTIESKPKGLCLIFNNYKFDKLPGGQNSQVQALEDRNGTDVDLEKLKKLFTQLGFQVVVEENLTSCDMLNKSVAYSRTRKFSEFHEKSDAFVWCILSHGIRDAVFGTDGKEVNINSLTYFFKGSNCPELIGKPKMLFVQACRGIHESKAVVPLKKSEQFRTDGPTATTPDEADWVIGQATSQGHMSFRSESHGTWYITKLCENLNRYHGRKYDLLQILTKVNQDLAKGEADFEDKYGNSYIGKQQPVPYFTINKNIYLTCINSKCKRCS